jgi:hypothetical protein
MRLPHSLAALAAAAAMIGFATPSLSLELPRGFSGRDGLVTRVADLGTGRTTTIVRSKHRHRHARNWRHRRAFASRWLHLQYVNAGYPVRHYHRDVYFTYLPAPYCYGFRRYW